MKKNKPVILLKKLIKTFVYISLIVISAKVQAQNAPATPAADSAMAKLSRRLSVSSEKAQQISAAFHANQEAIAQLLADKAIKPQQKQQQFLLLLAQRQAKIDSVLTPGQKQLLRKDITASGGQQAGLDAQRKRHLQQINRVPHKRVLVSSKADTVIKPNTVN